MGSIVENPASRKLVSCEIVAVVFGEGEARWARSGEAPSAWGVYSRYWDESAGFAPAEHIVDRQTEDAAVSLAGEMIGDQNVPLGIWDGAERRVGSSTRG